MLRLAILFAVAIVAMPSSWTKERARVAALTRAVRAGERTQEELDEAIRAFKASRIERYAAEITRDWPALTEEQMDRVAALLRIGSRGDR
jgi:hypothetical protein